MLVRNGSHVPSFLLGAPHVRHASPGTLLLGLILLLCSGCAEESTPATTVEAACRDAATAFCAKAETCSAGTWMRQHFAVPSDCVARFSLGCRTMAAHPHARVTVAAVRACAEAIQQQQCSYLGASPFSLLECTFAGALPEGAACSDDSQCQSRECDRRGVLACGTCRAPAVVGTDCFEASSRCTRVGLACSRGTDRVCIPTPPATLRSGEQCFPFQGSTCAEGLVCSANFCYPRGTAGGALLGASCAGGCEPWTACDRSTDRCIANALAAAGMPCGYLRDRPSPVGCVHGACSVSEGSSGTCAPWAEDGAACSLLLAGPHCRPPARCVVSENRVGAVGVCRLPGAVTCP